MALLCSALAWQRAEASRLIEDFYRDEEEVRIVVGFFFLFGCVWMQGLLLTRTMIHLMIHVNMRRCRTISVPFPPFTPTPPPPPSPHNHFKPHLLFLSAPFWGAKKKLLMKERVLTRLRPPMTHHYDSSL